MSIAEQLRAGRRDIELPAVLRLAGGEAAECEAMLRLFPAKRAVMRAKWRGRPALVKLFLDTPSGRRGAQRERAGYDALKTVGMPTPELLLDAQSADGDHALVFTFVERARRLGDAWRAGAGDGDGNGAGDGDINAALIGLQLIARLHRNACAHTDPHLDNFLIDAAGARVYVIDVGAIARKPNTGYGAWQRGNLAYFLAQFAPLQRRRLSDALPAHYPAAAADSKLPRAVEQAWRARVARYMKKCMRECSDFAVHKTWRRLAVWKRACAGDDLRDFLRAPDAWMARGDCLKAGNSATVARARMDGREVVIKRNNIKHAGHGARRSVRATRSCMNWRNAHLLAISGIKTPQPIAFVERRWGPLRAGGYYVSAFCDAPSAAAQYRDAPPSDAELQHFRALFSGMHLARLCHGDFKASNLLVTHNGIALIDLDSLKMHARAATHRQCAAKDGQRFLLNWQDKPGQREVFEEILSSVTPAPC